MLELFKLNHTPTFPAPELALDEPNGLLAFGGDLSVTRLLAAYQNGIFPWYAEGEPILWWSPNPRAIFYANNIIANKSLRKSIRKFGYTCRLNSCFEEVIDYCAKVKRRPNLEQAYEEPDSESTWISQDMRNAYIQMHQQGHAHSVEVFNRQNELVGGLYGIVVNGVFSGESMFHLQTDASKAALLGLANHMQNNNMVLIDCQISNPHLERLGCEEIDREHFLEQLQRSKGSDCWHSQQLPLLA